MTRGRPKKLKSCLHPTFAPTPQIYGDKIEVTREHRLFLQKQALEIFAAAANDGFSFQDCLAHVYSAGINHATQVIKDKPELLSPESRGDVFTTPEWVGITH